jgi:hypothetical protein
MAADVGQPQGGAAGKLNSITGRCITRRSTKLEQSPNVIYTGQEATQQTWQV